MSTQSNLLSQDRAPGNIVKSAGVRRVNNLPIVIFGAIMLVFMLLMMIVAMNRAAERNQPPPDTTQDVQSSQSFASLIAKDYVGGMIEPKNPPAVPDSKMPLPGLIIERPADLDRPPLPPGVGVQPSNPAQNPDLAHIRMLKRQQLEEAIKAKTQVNVVAPRSSTSSPNTTPTRDEMLAEMASVRHQIDSTLREDPTTAYQARLAKLRMNGHGNRGDVRGLGAGRGEEVMDDMAPRLVDDEQKKQAQDYSRFDSTDGEKRWTLNSDVQKPASRYVLQAGFVIPATLISGINSSLPGQIMAQVSQHIYDSPVGRWRLIPQGSRLVGTYSSDVEYGQARVLVAWQRIIFPDGKTMDIGAMPGADGLGYAGFNDQVNNHYLRIFGSALIMSAIVAGSTYSQRDAGSTFGRQNAGSIMSQALGQQLGLVTANLIRKNLNISPTLQIRPGYRFNIIVTKDLRFSKPYQSFDY
ncbi:conjugal transfer protein TrbI [Nitrosomonas sp. JL21]|uniref:TrbI/VirB10 family protein n=1 Tax=Nitrosomonas sp. JL21 TaxID=153949 RepID=UPI00136C56C3|nr:TrbI/VirB10 family protein [Nitrosomonas sp. JL21]MXS77951.1 conjugal transfer protein TrbI [Nitrosomonas sp. JL21]